MAKNTLVGVYTLWWLISMDVPFPKSSYSSVKMTIYFDIINLVGNYMVVNELKSPYENKPFNYFFNVHVEKIKIKIHTKMIMIWAYENMVHFRPIKSS
jgi:hypothetical protein